MRSARVLGAAATALLIGGAAVWATSPRAGPRLAGVRTFALALAGAPASALAGYDLVVLDGESAPAGEIVALHRAHTRVLGYLDVGTIEPGRAWYRAAAPYRMDYWPDWGEWYARVSAPGYRDLIARRVAPALLARGFDGLFLDNTDMVDSHASQTAGMRALVGSLAGLVHGRGGLLFAQNGEASIGPELRYLDGWNREDVTYTYDFASRSYAPVAPSEASAARGALARIHRRGIFVTATDYLGPGQAAATASAVRDACAAGAVPFVSDIGLHRVPQPPLRC